MAKKQTAVFERILSGQAARQWQARMLAYQKHMRGAGRHGRR